MCACVRRCRGWVGVGHCVCACVRACVVVCVCARRCVPVGARVHAFAPLRVHVISAHVSAAIMSVCAFRARTCLAWRVGVYLCRVGCVCVCARACARACMHAHMCA